MPKQNIQKFMVCAFNDIDNPNSESERQRLVQSIIKYLKSREIEQTAKEEDAHLVIIAPMQEDVFLTLDDLRFFHCLLPGKSKKVLYIHPSAPSAFHHGKIKDWCFFVRRCGFSAKELSRWLQDELHNQPSDKPATKEECDRHLFHVKKDMEVNDFNKLKRNLKNSINNLDIPMSIKLDIIKIFQSRKPVSKYYCDLVHISSKHAALEHILNRLKNQKNQDKNKKTSFQILKQFIDTCLDLRSALTALAWQKNDCPAKKLVLLIDDQPHYVKDDIKYIFKTFLPKMELVVWNPEPLSEQSEQNALHLYDIEHYGSFFQLKKLLLRKIKATTWTTSANPLSTLKDIILKVDFVFVDILFLGADGNDEEKGYRVIQGLHRIFRDAQDKKLIPELDDPELDDHALPEIVAISRADDMEKALKAFLHGAAGYVLKSRLLALPSALHRARYSALEPAHTTHRNFRMLYNLPHETIGLLRTAKIPHNLEFHVSSTSDRYRDKILKYRKIKDVLPMARLLTSLPKADLHVHVGSCMSPEFLVTASIIMLLRHSLENQEKLDEFKKNIAGLIKFWSGEDKIFEFRKELCLDDEFCKNRSTRILRFNNTNDGIVNFARLVRRHLKEQIRGYLRVRNDKDKKTTVTKWYEKFRSILHQSLDIPDHLDEQNVLKKMSKKPDAAMFQFAMTNSGLDGKPILHDKDDLLRIFVLFLAAGNKDNTLTIPLSGDAQKVRLWFTQFPNIEFDDWEKLHKYFWEDNLHNLSPDRFREYNWKLRRITNENKIEVNLNRGNADETCLHLQDCPDFENDPVSYLLATGTRCRNLRTYLEGCEFSGAEHLRHPYLIHLYAQQTVYRFVTQGVMYAELRAAVSGYEYKDFTFQNGCDCMRQAFQQAQSTVLERYEAIDDSVSANYNSIWLWESPFAIESLFQNLHSDMAGRQFPVKVSLILTGKRHKSTRQILREAASATVLHTLPSSDIKTAQKFATEDMNKCRIVGFDLAGQEDDDHAPHLFRSEFEQISKMHIPITVHAGENAPAGFVESAVLDLRARRIGHGLALIEDKQLMNRLREDGVCVELCPVSNFQTNQFVPAVPADGKSLGREYPLRAFLKNGNAVCLNTDNPIISYTNMVKECFQASYSFGGKGLSLWELLRILRMGFVHSFLSLPERRSMLELADQILFDLFSDPGVVEDLRCMAACRDEKKGKEK